jgi:hypothetical protein
VQPKVPVFALFRAGLIDAFAVIADLQAKVGPIN